MYKKILFFCLVILELFLFGCETSVELYLTTGYGERLLEFQRSEMHFSEEISDITINPEERFQTIDGFGASMTESSAYCIYALPEEARSELMQEFFSSETGIGISLLRQPMGSSDFALSSYSYNDIPIGETDFALEHFSIDRDREYIIPLLKQALDINPELKIIASPWSPPAWMKTGESLLGGEGGTLREDCYSVYADYFIRFLQAYAAEGIPVYAVTPQNEMNYAPVHYAGMFWSAEGEATFIGSYLGPALEQAQLETKILCYDHNWDRGDLAETILSDSEASKYVDGSAWHYYGGSAETMSSIHQQFPEKEIWFTEGGSGTWISGGSFSGTFSDSMTKAVGIMNNWSGSFIWWNLALDENNGPIVFRNSANYGLVQINRKEGTLIQPYRASWYALAHFSTFVRPGAVRVFSQGKQGILDHTAFLNPDGSLVVVIFNRFLSGMDVSVGWGHRQVHVEIPSQGAVTLVSRL